MISDQRNESSDGNVETPTRGLTIEESFFLELLQKKEKQVINLKFTPKGAQIGNLEPFSNYYSEAEIIRLLDSLVSKKSLIKQEKGTVLLCPKCGGHANMPVLVCPRCGSTKIGRKEDLNHSECEYWGPREEYVDGVLLRCPRCDELLDERAIEGTSGYFSVSDPYFECQDCGTTVSKNNITMVCIKCSNKYTTVQASYLNSVSYVLAQGVTVKPQGEPPKSIQERMKKKYKPETVEEPKPAPEPITIEEKIEEKPEKIEKPVEQKPEIEEEPETLQESPEEPEKIELEVLPEPEIEPEPEPVVEPEPEIIPEPATKKKKKKKNKSSLQNPMNRLSEMFKKKSKKKPAKKKSIKKTSIKKKIKPEPLPEPEPEEDEYEPNEEEYEEEHVPENRFYEETPKPRARETNDSYQILMVVENVTVSEFVLESLERVKKPINVLHMEDGALALKELKHKYDVLILDFDMKSIESKFMLSEMEKWGIMTPIIVLSDEDPKLEKYILNIEAVLKKKQKAINNIGKILQKLL